MKLPVWWAYLLVGLVAVTGRAEHPALGRLQPVFTAVWPSNRIINIVCHGHSVPAGYLQPPAVSSFEAYPHLLHRGLQARFPQAVINVIVTARGSEDAEQGARRFAADVLTHRPDVVTLDYGLNDVRIGVDRARQAWTDMIRQAQARGVAVILLTPNPERTTPRGDPANPLHQHAEQIRSLGREFDLPVADSLAVFERQPLGTELLSDACHPNRVGHALIAQALLDLFPPGPLEATKQAD